MHSYILPCSQTLHQEDKHLKFSDLCYVLYTSYIMVFTSGKLPATQSTQFPKSGIKSHLCNIYFNKAYKYYKLYRLYIFLFTYGSYLVSKPSFLI